MKTKKPEGKIIGENITPGGSLTYLASLEIILMETKVFNGTSWVQNYIFFIVLKNKVIM